MTATNCRVPKLRRHKTGQGFVELSGRRIYLGRHDLPEAQQKYHRLVAEWLANGRQLPAASDSDELTIIELVALYWKFAEGYYVQPDGTHTGEISALRVALRPLKALYGHAGAAAFGPRALCTVRHRMIGLGWCRKSINVHVGRIKRVFRWGVEQEIVPGSVYHALQAVRGLRAGRSEAVESEPVRPVAVEDVEAIQTHVSRQVWALIQIQLFTGARAGELVIMRPGDVDRTGRVWVYRPRKHKGQHHGHARTIYLGPQAQAALNPFLFRGDDVFCFSPAEAERERRETRRQARKTPESCGNTPGSNRKRRPRRRPGEHYTTGSYGKAIRRGCEDAKITPWHSHQLRHTAATMLRREFGLETARVVLGHRSPQVTDLYAEADRSRAAAAMAEVG